MIRTITLFCIAFICSSVIGRAQSYPVKTWYDAQYPRTTVSILNFVLLENADSTMKMDLSYTHPGQKQIQLPDSIEITFKYFTPKMTYLDRSSRSFAIVAAGQRIDVGVLGRAAYKAILRNWKVESYFYLSELEVDVNPSTDRSGKPIKRPFLETLSTNIDRQTFLQIAQADSIQMVIANDVFSLTEDQIKAMRKLADLSQRIAQ